MSKDLINQILEDIGLEKINHNEQEKDQDQS